MVTDILNREIHVGDTVLRARTRNGRGVLWSICKVVSIMNVLIKIQNGKYTTNVAPRNCIVIDENDIPENWQDEY
jgi:hypothetical protein|nr:MAG TPA: hypothetical protein [Caudoviricetes sp.]